MDELRQNLAPMSDAAWNAVRSTATEVLKVNLAARKLVDFQGPRGWTKSSIKLGRTQTIEPPGRGRGAKARAADGVAGVVGRLRRVQPLVELEAPFELSREELDDIGRGARDADLDPLIEAATRIARAEDHAVFHGWAAAGIGGIVERSSHKPLAIPKDYEAYPATVAEATRLLRTAGVDGPYGIALGPRCYTGLVQATAHGGYPVLDLVRQLVGGPVVWAPAVDGAVVVSMRGGDFELTIGQDFSVGYRSHTDAVVRLYLVETMTFRVLTEEAAVHLHYP